MVDLVALVLALGVLCARLIWRAKLKLAPVFEIKSAVTDYLAASTVVPFLLMLASPIEKRFFDMLLASSASAIWIAGGVGLLFVLRELLTPPQ